MEQIISWWLERSQPFGTLGAISSFLLLVITFYILYNLVMYLIDGEDFIIKK